MIRIVDFGYEHAAVPIENARVIMIFASGCPVADVGRTQGPGAVLDASRHIELFEMQLGDSPMAPGVASLLVEDPEAITPSLQLCRDSLQAGRFPVTVSADRSMTGTCCDCPTVALFGKVGRPEMDEFAVFARHPAVLAGVRAATGSAFQSVPATVSILTAHALKKSRELFVQALGTLDAPVHLCIDIDVLAPGVARNDRSLEPGGLDWYDLIALLDLTAAGPGIRSIDITGTRTVMPRSPAAVLCAQLALRACAMAGAHG
jgi:hypothetical protein